MSTVCYCGQSDCPVTTWEHDACIANLRAERDALRAQVEAARKACATLMRSTSVEWEDAGRMVLRAMDEAAK